MTAKELAEMLPGREVGNEIGGPAVGWAKDAGLVVVYGYSDDNVEFCGAINYETDSYDGGTVYLTKDGVLEGPACSCAEDCECPYFAKEREKAKTIKAVWHDEGGPCWTFETDILHENFTILEDGEPWCIGIVFSMKDLEEQAEKSPSFTPGAELWVLERDEEGNACEVFGYMFLAEVAGFVIASSYINDLESIEDTELEPEEIVSVQEEPWCVFYFNRHCNLDGDFCSEGPGCPQEMSPEDAVRLLKLAQAEKDGRLMVLPDAKYTDADGEKALQKAMWTCGNTNNPVTRYTADAIAEKLCRDARDENPPLTLKQLQEMDGEPVWIEDLLIPKCSCYHFVQKIGRHILLMEPRYYPAEDVMIPHYCANDENQGYQNTWLAYRRKPEEGAV